MFYATEHTDGFGHVMNNKEPKTNQQITSESQNDRHQVTQTLVPAEREVWLHMVTSTWRGQANTSASLVLVIYTIIWFSLGQDKQAECRKNYLL